MCSRAHRRLRSEAGRGQRRSDWPSFAAGDALGTNPETGGARLTARTANSARMSFAREPSSSRVATAASSKDYNAAMTTLVDEQDVPQEYDERSSENSEQSSLTWIAWFCSIPGHEYFCEVAEEFIEDDFNLTGLNSMVPFWKEAMEMVLDVEPEDTLKIPDVSIVEQSAEVLYGLVHQRYILTRAGLQAMAEKYDNGQFGSCPRVYCQATPVVPCGRTDLPGIETVKLYCPNCHDLYTPPSSRYQSVDGAFFGTTFPQLFFQTYRELAPASYFNPTEPRDTQFTNTMPHGGQRRAAGDVYVPKIYGFRVSERAKSGPRMRWLRMRPQTSQELDAVDWRGRWIGSDDGYDEDDEDGDNPAPLEDFDPDAGDDDDEESESEEEEEAQVQQVPIDHGAPRRRAAAAATAPLRAAPREPSPSSSSTVHTPDDDDEMDEERPSLKSLNVLVQGKEVLSAFAAAHASWLARVVGT